MPNNQLVVNPVFIKFLDIIVSNQGVFPPGPPPFRSALLVVIFGREAVFCFFPLVVLPGRGQRIAATSSSPHVWQRSVAYTIFNTLILLTTSILTPSPDIVQEVARSIPASIISKQQIFPKKACTHIVCESLSNSQTCDSRNLRKVNF